MTAAKKQTSSQYQKLQQQISCASNEEEVRLAWVRALEESLQITFNAERGKRDLSYNNVVIEFKDRGKFNGKTSGPAFQEAINERLLPYIIRTAKAEHIDQSDYIGIATDGIHLCFAQVIDGIIYPQHLLEVTPVTFDMVVEACRKSYRRAVTASNLIEDFGHDSPRGLALMRAMSEALSSALSDKGSKKIHMLYVCSLKVVWAEQSSNFSAAVATNAKVPLIGDRPYVPDHKIFFVDFYEEEPAYFLCGLLTSTLVKEFVESHNISIQVGDIFKHMSLPPFDKKNKKHIALAKLTKAAHDEHNASNRIKIISKIAMAADQILEDLPHGILNH